MRRVPSVGLSLLLALFTAAGGLQAQDGQKNLTRDRAANQKWAVLIGVDQYTNATKLDCCGKDALALKDHLVQAGFLADHVFVLHSATTVEKDRPFKANIQQQLGLVLGRYDDKGESVQAGLAGKGDLVVVSFSGHGVFLPQTKTSYLCPAETDLGEPQTLIALDQVYRQLQACPAEQKLLVVDACRNVPLECGARAPGNDDRVKDFAEALKDAPKGKGLLLLASCAPGECSYEEPEWGHGIFTYFLMEGLSGAADQRGRGYVTMLDLYQYANEKTRTYVANKRGKVQRPSLLSDIVDDFTIGTIPKPMVVKVKQIAGIDFVAVPGQREGEFFLMGSEKDDTDADGDEKPRHKVRIASSFYLGKFKVTVGQFKRFVNATGYKTEAEKAGDKYTWRAPGFRQTDEHPVVEVSWNDANAFCQWLAKESGGKVRLPREAEWEYSCSAGSTTKFYFGNNEADLEDYAWYVTNTGAKGTQPCGLKKPNAFGLFDMHGLAWEWCSDGKRTYPDMAQTNPPEIDPVGPMSDRASRVVRGGSFVNAPRCCRAAYRFGIAPSSRYDHVGFRVLVSR
jgi:formylglycine-generating enzyme required for sulfatase activity